MIRPFSIGPKLALRVVPGHRGPHALRECLPAVRSGSRIVGMPVPFGGLRARQRAYSQPKTTRGLIAGKKSVGFFFGIPVGVLRWCLRQERKHASTSDPSKIRYNDKTHETDVTHRSCKIPCCSFGTKTAVLARTCSVWPPAEVQRVAGHGALPGRDLREDDRRPGLRLALRVLLHGSPHGHGERSRSHLHVE